MIKFSDYLVNFLSKKGLSQSFGITGGGAMHLNDSFAKSKKIKSIFTHHEQSAAMAAESYYREIGKPCILNVTSGPGGTNSITGVAGAWIDSIPMFIISGQVESHHMIKNTKLRQIGIQEINIIDVVKKITKKSFFLKNLDNIEKKIEDLYKVMIDGRPGPVWLDVPLDIQKARFKIKKTYKKNQKQKAYKSFNVKRFSKLLNESKKPIIIAGNGVHISKTEKEFLKFISKVNIPVITSWNGSDLINTNNKNYIGRMGIFGDRAANLAAQNSDLQIIMGSRMSIPMIGYKTREFSKNAKKIIIEIDKSEIKKKLLSNVKLRINNSLKDFFKLIDTNLIVKNKSQVQWNNLTRNWKKEFNIKREKSHIASKKKNKLINSFVFINELSKSCSGNESIITDMGTSFTCTMQTFSIKNPKKQRLYTSSGLAAMGFGLPGAIGARIANPKKNIVCITGDGGFMFNIQELQTIKTYNLPIKIFILQNKGYLTMKLMQKKNFDLYTGSGEKSGVSFPDFKKISYSYGIKYRKLKKKNLKSQIKKILAEKQSIITEVEMNEFQELVPRLQNKMLKNGDFIIPKFDDLYPHLSEERLEEQREKANKI